jgi:transcriptional regulator with GAF, ATPase, and Fis domain
MRHVFDLITQVAPLTTSVLILGENGTGKEGVANCIHRLSTRNKKPFVKINCAALPVNLVESELFGYERGAFTGANERKIGKFEQASGGTILLDEIGDMSAEIQVKLLRVLQEKEIDRIGGKDSIKVDVRIIASTNKDLELEVAQGRFRIDLYYRLVVFPVIIPPLRERVEDIPALADHFLRLISGKYNIPLKKISNMALAELQRHTWPGNVRELEYLLERTVLLTRGEEIETVTITRPVDGAPADKVLEGNTKTLHEMEEEHILAVLKQANNRIAGKGGAAELLNLHPSTLYSKMKKLGIIRKLQE